jgi:ABC-2 type transport system ATP-binding protein/ribosome-dependent ATPase
VSLLALDEVTKQFGSIRVVDGVSLRVDRGDVVGLVGANGAGKTTLMRVSLGLLPPDGGSVALLDQPPSRQSRARVGYVPQSLGLWPELTAAEHQPFYAAVFGSEPVIEDPELLAMRNRRVGALPLGLQRRLAFALALGHDPELLVLDEPTSGVDPLGRARLWELIRSRADRGAGVLVSTHSMAEAESCDRVAVMVAGRKVADGPVDALIAHRSVVEVRGSDWAGAWTALDAAGLAALPAGQLLRIADVEPRQVRNALEAFGVIAEVRVVAATLEEVVFSSLTHG